MEDTCICCGQYVPEGRWVCRSCETKAENSEKKNDITNNADLAVHASS